MEYVEVDKTNLRVSRLAFGTASLHHLPRRNQRVRLLETALASGITHFDTSPYYGFGLAESDLGVLIRSRRDAVTITTKVGLYAPGGAASGSFGVWLRKAAGKIHRPFSIPRVDWSIQAAEESLNASLKRLGTEYVDILFLHEPDPDLVRSEEILSWLERERSKGRIRYWGLAGTAALLETWVRADHPLAMVVQTKDSLHQKEADLVLNQGRRLQFTYGYLSSSKGAGLAEPAEMLLRKALRRNQDGVILFSTRRADRITRLAGIVQ